MNDFIVTDCAYAVGYKLLSRHMHMAYEIIFVKNGMIELNVNGVITKVNGGTIIFLSALEEHSIKILSSEYERYYINLSTRRLDKMIADPQLVSICKNRPATFNHCIKAPKNAQKLFEAIIEEYENIDRFSEEIIKGKIYELLATLYRQNKAAFPLPAQNVKSEIFEVQQYIEKNFKNEIMISELADKFYINKYYLTHSFKELTGYSPKQYLLLNRLSFAKELLINSDFNISQIAQKAGFYDSNSFIRSFKNEYGITPNSYRK